MFQTVRVTDPERPSKLPAADRESFTGSRFLWVVDHHLRNIDLVVPAIGGFVEAFVRHSATEELDHVDIGAFTSLQAVLGN